MIANQVAGEGVGGGAAPTGRRDALDHTLISKMAPAVCAIGGALPPIRIFSAKSS
jgi:hypothetical protein